MTVSGLWLFLTLLWVGLQCVIVVFPDHAHFFLASMPICYKYLLKESGLDPLKMYSWKNNMKIQ